MNFRVTVVFLSILAFSHHVESKPAEPSPDVSSKSDSANNENLAPSYNGKPGPNDVSTTSLPVGGGTTQASDRKMEDKASASSTTLISAAPTNATTAAPGIITNATNATNPTVPTTTQSISTVTIATTKITAVTTTSSKSPEIDTTPLPTQTTTKPSVTTATPISETSTQSITVKDRRFDGPSFIGGIVLSLGTMAIGFVAFKFYKARTERNYHTL